MIRILILGLLISTSMHAQRPAMLEMIDVERYTIQLDLSNFTNEIKGLATIEFAVAKPGNTIVFDLVKAPDNNKTGMKVLDVKMDEAITWNHSEDKITISKTSEFDSKKAHKLTITFEGLPADGLIISKNKHQEHTAFGDNWPNRAHHWFPCIDHPADKAFIEWKVNFPSTLKLVANGKLLADSLVTENTKHNHWKSMVPLPTKVMVIGLADFAVSEPCLVNDIEVTSWVFKQQKEQGFSDYEVACEVLLWFQNKIADYPYAKLANVQSKTRYGGMENASCIFYFENSVNGKGEVEDLIAHEIAHQWFGNSASEIDWPHLWLSEGFATYLTDVYIQEKYGDEAFKNRLVGERSKAINFYTKYKAPVVDTLANNPNLLLNPNSYQKGAWFLHMLRNQLGDSLFWESVHAYYDLYKLGNASTNDFMAVVNQVSEKDYTQFANQWLKTTGHPNLEIESKLIRNKKLEIKIEQKQKVLFEFDLELFAECKPNGTLHTFQINKKKMKFTIDLEGEFENLEIDPNANLFFEYNYKHK
ncbi:MAG: M1 family metallopeptidase [Bacteroidia bacterium]